jgi:hypothetical protein
LTRQRLRLLLLGSVALAACLVAACADIFGVHSADFGDGSAGDGGLDAPYDYVLYDKVPIDVNTAVCDGGVPVLPADQAYWVSDKIGDDSKTTCGTQAAPCKTINHLLSLISGSGPHAIYLDNSVFHEQLAIGTALRGFTIQGGFVLDDAGTWTATCANNLTYISAEEGGAATISITDLLDAGLTLRLMQVETKVNGAVGGESVYAVLVVNSDVLLDNVNLYAQNGGPGQVGGNGVSPIPGTCNSTGGGSGAPGTNADAGGSGSFTTTPAGFVPDYASNGSNGALGTWTSGNASLSCGTCVTGCN